MATPARKEAEKHSPYLGSQMTRQDLSMGGGRGNGTGGTTEASATRCRVGQAGVRNFGGSCELRKNFDLDGLRS